MIPLEQRSSVAKPGPHPRAPERAQGRLRPSASAAKDRARKPGHDVGRGSIPGTGSTEVQADRRKLGDLAHPPPDAGPPSGWPDLIAFVAVLITGTLLVLFGHVATGGLTTAFPDPLTTCWPTLGSASVPPLT